jgi:hypothetical protein
MEKFKNLSFADLKALREYLSVEELHWGREVGDYASLQYKKYKEMESEVEIELAKRVRDIFDEEK